MKFSVDTITTAFKKYPFLRYVTIVSLLGIVFGTGFLAWQKLLEKPTTLPPITNENSKSAEELPAGQIPVDFKDLSTEIKVNPLSKCINLSVANSGWNTENGRKNIQTLKPTMIRVKTSELIRYTEVGNQKITDLVKLVSDEKLETLFVIDLVTNTLEQELKTLSQYQEEGGKVSTIELVSSFPDLYSVQVTRFLPEITPTFPNAKILLQGQYNDVSLLKNSKYDGYGLEVAYKSNITSFENYTDGIQNSIKSPQLKTLDTLKTLKTDRTKWITSYRIDENLNATTGPAYSPFINLQLGGTWGQAIATSMGYHTMLQQNIEVICIDSLSQSPQNSLYYLDTNTKTSTYPVLSGKDFEFTPVGNAFYMVSKAIGNTESDGAKEFKIENKSDDIAIWVFASGEGNRAWVVNSTPSELALDMGKYGFEITAFETKSAPVNQVILSRSDVKTQNKDSIVGLTKILLDPYSISVFDLKSVPKS
jgi:hypothetical protein